MQTTNSQAPDQQVRPNHVYKTIAILLTIIVIVLAGWLLLGNALDSGSSTGKPPVDNSQTDGSPDQAKQQGGNNSDTIPSPNGGQGNSLLNQ